MYIDRYWKNYIGGTDDSLNLIAFLEDQHKEEIPLHEIFYKIGLDKQNWDFHQTVEYLEFTHSDGTEIDFHFAIDVITDLAAILLECKVNGTVDIHDLDDYAIPSRRIRITATADEHAALNHVLKNFVENPFSYDLHELVDDEQLLAFANDVEEIRKALYESDGSIRNHHKEREYERNTNDEFYPIEQTELEKEEDNMMELLLQCQKWHENCEYQKIIDALENIPAQQRSPMMDSELARAYNNWGAICLNRAAFKKAIALLQQHEAYFENDHLWNFRMGYSYYYLDQDGKALSYFHKALEACPDDEDTKALIEHCEKRIAMPQFKECFKERTAAVWEEFVGKEKELRQIMDEDQHHERGEELVKKCEEILTVAFDDISFELGNNGEKYELILTPEGDKVKLFELVYFQKHVPEEILEHWNILVGRQADNRSGLRIDGIDINGDDVQVWVEEIDKENLILSAYCEKLLPFLQKDEDKVWWMLTTLTDQVLGEISHMRYINSFNILESAKEEDAVLLSKLPEKIQEMGYELVNDAEAYLEVYTGYGINPNEDPDADWRLDTIAGSTCCSALINGYFNYDDDFVDELHVDGSVAGFLCYPLETLKEEEGSQKIFDFRDRLETWLMEECGEDVLTLIGGATGVNVGYVDFIAWDIEAVIQAAKAFFEATDLPWASFHTFNREAATVQLKESTSELDEILSELDYIPYTSENAEEFFQQIQQWNDDDEYLRSIQALNAIPLDWRNYRISYALARALENYAIIGDHAKGTPNCKGDEALRKAINVLESVREEGENKAEWNMRMAYAYQYLYGQEEKAIPYARRWAELDPDDPDAISVLHECRREIRKRNHILQCKKYQFVPGSTPFENFDLTDFWDDSDYALKEYVNDPPSDELIKSIEEELGYKLPASYIWLMKQHNGGIPKNTCFPSDEPTSWAEDHIAITGIMGIGKEKACSLCGSLGSQFMIDEWEYPPIGVAICDCPSAGHDMIFLDYRECGPQGEPKVVHVDQENDYKITLLADSFEEFICGLEEEDFFNDDDDFDDYGHDDGETQENDKGQFVGFVLMSKGQWDKQQLISDLKEKWNIDVQEDEEGKREDSIVFEIDDMIAAVSLMPYPIPNREAEINAENNYMWLDAVDAAREHSAHIMVAVLGQEEDVIKKGKLFTKLAAACCCQEYATGVYTSGVVFEPAFYEGFADMMKEDELPIYNWIWFGMVQDENGLSAYTYGMNVFGKDEMEVLNAEAEPEELRDFLVGITAYVLEGDVELHDGETIGFSADDIHTIQRSEGVLLPKMTLKISYEPSESEDSFDDFIMDDGIYHVESIAEKELPVDEINAYNHMAIYLRWCMEHDLMSDEFLEEFKELVDSVKTNPLSEDLRHFIWDTLDGKLNTAYLNRVGKAFAFYYYGHNDAPYYPNDIDSYAVKQIGEERNYSDEIKDEAYLFIPFDEAYYQAMASLIDRRFVNWQEQAYDEDTLEASELAQAMIKYLDCECEYFPSMKDDDPIMSAYNYAIRDGAHEGYVPMLVKVDEILWECLIMNSDPDSDVADGYEFNPENVAGYRKQMLSTLLQDGKEVLEKYLDVRKAEAEDDEMNWEEEVIGTMKGGYDNCRFSSYWNSENHMTYPLILAKIPVNYPWEIFAYLPFGNWNECPDTLDLMAISKYWFEKYSALPSAMTHDELEFLLPEPIDREKAIEVAMEQYGFCPDIVDQEQDDPTIGSLADVLWQSTVWYFWWD